MIFTPNSRASMLLCSSAALQLCPGHAVGRDFARVPGQTTLDFLRLASTSGWISPVHRLHRWGPSQESVLLRLVQTRRMPQVSVWLPGSGSGWAFTLTASTPIANERLSGRLFALSRTSRIKPQETATGLSFGDGPQARPPSCCARSRRSSYSSSSEDRPGHRSGSGELTFDGRIALAELISSPLVDLFASPAARSPGHVPYLSFAAPRCARRGQQETLAFVHGPRGCPSALIDRHLLGPARAFALRSRGVSFVWYGTRQEDRRCPARSLVPPLHQVERRRVAAASTPERWHQRSGRRSTSPYCPLRGTGLPLLHPASEAFTS